MLIVAKEDRLHSIFKSTNYVFIVLCCTSFIFVTEVLLGVYVYRAKSDIHEVYLKEIRSNTWRNEIRQILDDPKFCELYGCFKKKTEDDRIWKNHKYYEDLLVANKNPTRKKRNAFCKALESEGCLTKGEPGIQGVPGIPGIPGKKGDAGPVGPMGFKGERGDSGIPGSLGLKGDVGLASVPGVKGEQGLKGPKGADGEQLLTGEKGESAVPELLGSKGANGEQQLKWEKGESAVPEFLGPKGADGEQRLKGEKGESAVPELLGPTTSSPTSSMSIPVGPPGSNEESELEEVDGKPVWGTIPGNPTSTENHPKPATNAPILKPSEPTTTLAPALVPQPGSEGLIKIETSDKNQSYPGLPTRATKCLLNNVQKPSVKPYGITTTAVMFDLSDSKRVYVTYNDKKYLYEIDGRNQGKIGYTLDVMIEGNAHAMDRRCFFYHAAPKRSSVIKYNLFSKVSQVLDIPGINSTDLKLLYSTKKNYLDFHVDENGLWLLFSIYGSSDLNVMKIDSSKLQIQAVLNVAVDHEKFEEMFIASGVLYGIKREGVKEAKIVFALDLYTGQTHDVNIKLSTWYKSKSATYDYKHKNLRVISHKGELVLYHAACK